MNPPRDPFAAIATYYDLDLEGFDYDVDLYLHLLQSRHEAVAEQGTNGRPLEVLELGCGTGRVAAALAREGGAHVTGLDVSTAMLAVARERSASLPVVLVEGDMRTFDLQTPGSRGGGRFDVVLVPLGGLQHLETPDDIADTFERMAAHLAPEGVVVVDVESPAPEDFEAGPQPLVEHWTREHRGPRGAERVTKLVSIDGRPSRQLRDVTWHFDVQPVGGADGQIGGGATGGLRRVTEQFTLRVITAGELALAGRAAGLQATGWFGDYELTPFDDGAERLIAMFERADPAGAAGEGWAGERA